MRALATIQRIGKVRPIKKADAIECAVINGWEVVIGKNQFKEGDLVVYCEIDSFLPIKEEYEFLRKTSYRMMGEEEGFALRTMCFRDQISQGLLLPLSCLPADTTVEIGKDVSKLINVKLFELPLPKELLETSIGYLPSKIVRTDQMRIQNLASSYEEYSDLLYYISEKIDGASTSAFLVDDALNIGSKDVNFKESDNIYWRTARKYNFGEILRDYRKETGLDVSIQGELTGQGLLGGTDFYELNDSKIFVYRVVNNTTRRVLSYQEFNDFCTKYNLETVPLIGINQALPKEFNMDFFQKTSTFKSALNVKKDAEGVVYTSMDGMKSFKIISNKFLLKA